MRKGAVLAVSSPLLASLAIREQVDPEDLGGWRLHAEVTGFADRVVDTDAEALDDIRRFLSYLPSHHGEAAPIRDVPPASGREMGAILDHIPASRTQVYDVRRIIETVVDDESFFELKPRFGKSAVIGLARLDGQSVGIVANNPLSKGGAMDSERKRAPGKIMNFMNALSLVTVPKISVILRKSYGQAYLNMGGGRNSDEVIAWPTAEVSFMDPHFAVRVVQGLEPGDDGYDEALESMSHDSEVWDMASVYAVQSVIRPEDTRDQLIRTLGIHRLRLTGGVGRHLMANWPTSF
jgi:acetyl-CoA carboxylase carboxyltransferase component